MLVGGKSTKSFGFRLVKGRGWLIIYLEGRKNSRKGNVPIKLMKVF
jgi:hypothetical protein